MLHQRQETIPSIIRDYSEWHKGRRTYGVWLLDVSSGEVLRKVDSAKAHLSEYLLSPYLRGPHITIFVCGFLTDAPRLEDDYGREQFWVHSRALSERNIRPFSLEIGGLNSFASAPYLEVRDPEGGIERAREVLSASAREIERETFTPHITVGLYSGAFPSKDVVGRLSTFEFEPARLTLDRITFATYEAREIAGPLTHRYDVSLRAD